ncbi:CAP domain-containing protein [Bacillus xiapuensis]|uniref:CAP domain-containing protein n=1 Tax=Bacillus xiapuensis TaxID=2014075 RepID=UPI000C249754|nr:CAP domain-containing protein [Bacillus xiapuensis]
MSIVLIVGIYLNQSIKENEVLENSTSVSPQKASKELEKELEKGSQSVSVRKAPEKGSGSFVGKPSKEVIHAFGQPVRKDPSAYGYEWWVYKKANQYMQFGIENNRVVSAYAAGQADAAPFKLGQRMEGIFQSNPLDTEVVVKNKTGTYRFELSEEDYNIRPLIPLGDIYAQLYIDQFTGKLSSVRFLTKDCLIKLRPYELVYRGELPAVAEPSAKRWAQIERGSEQQILDLTNIIRARFDLGTVKWEPAAAAVAKRHSKEMFEKNYFAHESPTAGDLGDRLQAADISYELAGENIAANYIDGPAAVEGWLNSKGHRQALLEKDFTLLGVGVYRKYYTQNFLGR